MGSSVTPVTVTFNGTSQYASSLQQVITRAVSIASLPMVQLEDQQQTTSQQITDATSLETTLTALNTSIQGLSSSSGNTQSTSVSDSSVLQATASSAALPGTYTIQVLDPGSSSSAMSSDGLTTVTDPTSQDIGSSSAFTLTVGSSTHTIQPSGNNLDALAQAINSSGAGVQATIVNVGSPESPDYRLAIQNTGLGAQTIQLTDSGSNPLLTSLTTGADGSYTVNGQPPAGITTDSSTVTISPGLTVSLLAAGTSTVSVSLDASSISTALNSFVTAFNAALAQVNLSYGQNANSLSGDSMVYETSDALNNLVQYSGSGNSGDIQSLTDLGITNSDTGTLTFDPSTLSSMSSSELANAVAFLGNSTSGFIADATSTLTGLTDPTMGLVTGEITNLNRQSTNETTQIDAQQNKVNELQTSLTNQMNSADALIASLEQQTTFLTSLFATVNANNNALA
ncbi:MAG: flagellar filament capping protein FliD [Bryobacteraceae bacterium]|jgi:flagellar hook-associated protein 2